MTHTLNAVLRDMNVSSKSIRTSELIPGVVYGPKQSTICVTVERGAFEKLFKTVGESTIITIAGLAKPVDVLIHGVDFSPTKGGIQHVDFYAVEQGKEMTAHVALEFVGESDVEKIGGMINKVMHEVQVTCMPNVLPAHITVDVSVLTELDQKIHVSELSVPKGVVVENRPEEVVVLVVHTRAEVAGDMVIDTASADVVSS
jgi:large subunit ribosomal protein L25